MVFIYLILFFHYTNEYLYVVLILGRVKLCCSPQFKVRSHIKYLPLNLPGYDNVSSLFYSLPIANLYVFSL
nr:MAG TPA: hypothetical protein [Caudoviricetes sp.]DAX02841.1 MAG TPA: hypothetical protein [Caudoviricetes sp.]